MVKFQKNAFRASDIRAISCQDAHLQRSRWFGEEVCGVEYRLLVFVEVAGSDDWKRFSEVYPNAESRDDAYHAAVTGWIQASLRL